MANTSRNLVAAIAFAPSIFLAQANDPVKAAVPGDLLLNPSTITITGHFESSPGPTTLELALRALTQQMDRKRAEDAARSPLEPLWKNPLWKYLPSDPAGTLNSPVGPLPDNLARNPLRLDDPFCTPPYLTFRGRQLDYELARSEERGLRFLSH